LIAIALRSNQVRAGRKPAASDRGVIPDVTRKASACTRQGA
jgi:hypothetical protein